MRQDWASMAVAGYVALLLFTLLDQLATGEVAAWVKEYQTLVAGGFALLSLVYLARQLREERDRHSSTARLSLRDEFDAIDAALEWTDVDRLNNHALPRSSFNTPPVFLPGIEADQLEYFKTRIELNTSRYVVRLAEMIDEYNEERRQPENVMYPTEASPILDAKAESVRSTSQVIKYILSERRRKLEAMVG